MTSSPQDDRDPGVPLDGETPWRRLAAAMLLQAVRDAQDKPWRVALGPGSPDEALEWLQCDFAMGLAEILDIEESLGNWLGRLKAKRQ